MLADSQTPALDINVDTQAGVVTLFGIVPSQKAKAAVKARDEELERAVKQTFETAAFKDISVEVKNGVVRLTGTVANGARRLEAAVLARSIQGVRAVKDDLRLATAKG